MSTFSARAPRSLGLALFVLCAGSATAQQTPGTVAADLAQRIDRIVEATPVDQAHWGILVVDLDSGDTLVARNHFRKFIPASNMKLLVTAAALQEFGADHRFRTELFAVGEREGEVLVGDLVLRPSGDPTWSERWFDDDPERALRDLALQVAASGIRTVSGELIVAASRWDSTAVNGSWMTFNVPWGFSAVPSPLAVAEATTTILVEGGSRVGDPALISWTPRAIPAFVQGEVHTVEAADTTAEVVVRWLPESEAHRLTGTVRADRVDSIEVSTRVPAREARTRLVQLLGLAGVTLLQLPTPVDTPRMTMGEDPEPGPATARRVRPRDHLVWSQADSLPLACDPERVPWCDLHTPLASWESAPLREIVRQALEPSQNWITEQLLWALGLRVRGRASWEDGTNAVVDHLSMEMGIDTLDLALRDGSGLSAYNLVTPRALTAVLIEMDRGPMAELWRDALAAPGERDSTLQYRLRGLEDRIQAKTGTISNVNSLSGYLRTDDDRRLVFSILTNGSGVDSSVMRRAIDRVVRELATPLASAAGGG